MLTPLIAGLKRRAQRRRMRPHRDRTPEPMPRIQWYS